MSLSSDGNTLWGLYGNGTSGQQALYSIDTATGTPTLVSSITGTNLGTRFYGASAQYVSTGATSGGGGVPEPGEWAAMGILGAGLTGLVLRKRRKG